MKQEIKNTIKNNRIFGNAIVGVYRIAKSIYNIPAQVKLYCQTKSNILSGVGEKRVYYIGIPAHNNLGDLAQGVCIRRWLKKNYADRRVVEIETNALVNTRLSALKYLKKVFSDDVIVDKLPHLLSTIRRDPTTSPSLTALRSALRPYRCPCC